MPRGAGLSLPSRDGGTHYLCILKVVISGKVSPELLCPYKRWCWRGNGKGRREVLPRGWEQRGLQERRLLHSGAVGCPKERVGWMERREEGMKGGGREPQRRKGKLPTERWNLGPSPWAGREEEDGGSLVKLEGGKENWDIMNETPQVRLWDRPSLS